MENEKKTSATPKTYQQVFCDASVWQSGPWAGCAIAALSTAKNGWEATAFSLGPMSDIDLAEQHGISHALSWCIANRHRASTFIIKCDNREVVHKIAKLTDRRDAFLWLDLPGDWEDLICKNLAILRREGKEVEFEWIKGHQGLEVIEAEGNRVVDDLAQKGSRAAKGGKGLGEWREEFFALETSMRVILG